jgi:hypothetical protein
MQQKAVKSMYISNITYTCTKTWLKRFCLFFVMFLYSMQFAFSQGINVDAPPVVEVNATRVSLSIGSENTTTSVTWNVPNAQIVYQSPNKSTIEVVFNTTGVKYIQAWHTNTFGYQQYGTVSIEVFGAVPVFMTGQLRQYGGNVLSGVTVDAQEIGGSGTRTTQTFYDGTYNFYVPKGTSWKIQPRNTSGDCINAFYPKDIYDVQQTTTTDFTRYPRIYNVSVSPTDYRIQVLYDSGELTNYWHIVVYTDYTQEPFFNCNPSGSFRGDAKSGKTIMYVYLADCISNCILVTYAN